jgi:hypothetical protein
MMPTKSLRFSLCLSLCLLGLVTMMMLTTGACSSSDNETGAAGGAGHGAAGGSGGGGSVDTSSPCYAYCMARETKKNCSTMTTVEDCLGYTYGCDDFADRSAACKAALMTYWSCIAAQADPCDLPGTCGTQAETVVTACGT